jgi:uncharacterized protein YqgC (DUF456 family)
MEMAEIIGLALALLIMAVGCLGSILPAVPSTPLVLGAAVVHKLYFQADSAGWIVMTLLVLITGVALLMDYLATVLGAKQFGATKKGMTGAIVGGIVGLFFNLPGILLGPFIGAVLFEMIGGREWKPACRAGIGATLGLLAGAVGKLVCCLSMMTLFIISVLWHTLRN